MGAKMSKAQLKRELTHLAAMVGELQEWDRGAVVELPSPAIPNRIDLVVIMIPYAEVHSEVDGENEVEITWPGGMIIRNRGEYDASFPVPGAGDSIK